MAYRPIVCKTGSPKKAIFPQKGFQPILEAGNPRKTVLLYFRRCQCNPGWTGDHCQIPEETECEDQIDNDKSKKNF